MTDAGNLTIESGVSINWAGDSSLIFDVDNDFVMEPNSKIINTGGGLVEIEAFGSVAMQSGSEISVNTGEIFIGGFDSITVSGPLNASSVNLYSLNNEGEFSIESEGGDFFLEDLASIETVPSTFALTLNSPISAQTINLSGSFENNVFNLNADLNAPSITIDGINDADFDEIRVNGNFNIGNTNLVSINQISGVGTSDTLIGPETNQIYELFNDNVVVNGGFSYLGFENVIGGSGNDQFLLDSEFNSSISIEAGDGNDRLRGRIGPDDVFVITANGAGTLNSNLVFSGFETLDGASGNDNFIFQNQATVDFVDGAPGTDTILINDSGLTSNQSYTISEGIVSRNPEYSFANIQGLTLLLGSGNDTVNTTGTSFLQALNGGPGTDTLLFNGEALVESPFSGITHVNFDDLPAPDELTDSGELLNLQIGNGNTDTPTGGPPTIENNFGNSEVPTLEQQFGLTPGIFNSLGGSFSAGVLGQALVILQTGNNMPGIATGIDGSPPPFGVIILLGEGLQLGAYSELAKAIDFDAATFMGLSDGPYSVDLSGPPPQDVITALRNSLLIAAALELQDALELGSGAPITAMDGVTVIGVGPGAPDPATIALLQQKPRRTGVH